LHIFAASKPTGWRNEERKRAIVEVVMDHIISPLFTRGVISSPRGSGHWRGFGKTLPFSQPPQILFHPNPLVRRSVFNLHKNAEVCEGYLRFIPCKTGLVNKLLGIFLDLELDQDNHLQSLEYTLNTLELYKEI
jgi:hypothetical protein